MRARIVSLETYPVGLPFRKPYVSAAGALERREMVLVRLLSSDGNEGWGDAVPLSLRGGASLARVRQDLEGCREALALARFEMPKFAGVEVIGALTRCRVTGASSPALGALNTALLDLAGKWAGKPVWSLLGAWRAERVPCNGTLGADEPEQAAAEAAALAAAGFTTLKVKVGVAGDRERLRAVRAAVGEEMRLRVDANRAWDVPTAIDQLQAIDAEVGLELAEQPCAALAELAEVRARTNVPVAADESVASRADARAAIQLQACDAATIKLAKVGGTREALMLSRWLPSYLSSALDSPLGIAAALHTAQKLQRYPYAESLAHGLSTSALFSDNIAHTGELHGSALLPPPGPGLGVEVDRLAVRRLRIA